MKFTFTALISMLLLLCFSFVTDATASPPPVISVTAPEKAQKFIVSKQAGRLTAPNKAVLCSSESGKAKAGSITYIIAFEKVKILPISRYSFPSPEPEIVPLN